MNEEKKRPETPETLKEERDLPGENLLSQHLCAGVFLCGGSGHLVFDVRQQRRAQRGHPRCAHYPAGVLRRQEEGLQIFSMSHTTADVEVSGNNLLTSQLSASDFEVSVTLNPTSNTSWRATPCRR